MSKKKKNKEKKAKAAEEFLVESILKEIFKDATEDYQTDKIPGVEENRLDTEDFLKVLEFEAAPIQIEINGIVLTVKTKKDLISMIESAEMMMSGKIQSFYGS